MTEFSYCLLKSSFFSSGVLRGRRMSHSMPNTSSARTARPPTTPPATAPALTGDVCAGPAVVAAVEDGRVEEVLIAMEVAAGSEVVCCWVIVDGIDVVVGVDEIAVVLLVSTLVLGVESIAEAVRPVAERDE